MSSFGPAATAHVSITFLLRAAPPSRCQRRAARCAAQQAAGGSAPLTGPRRRREPQQERMDDASCFGPEDDPDSSRLLGVRRCGAVEPRARVWPRLLGGRVRSPVAAAGLSRLPPRGAVSFVPLSFARARARAPAWSALAASRARRDAQRRSSAAPSAAMAAQRDARTLRVVSWNVNGLRAAQERTRARGLASFLNSLDADVVCLQETKLRPSELSLDLCAVPGWHCYYSCSETGRAHAGVATFSRVGRAGGVERADLAPLASVRGGGRVGGSGEEGRAAGTETGVRDGGAPAGSADHPPQRSSTGIDDVPSQRFSRGIDGVPSQRFSRGIDGVPSQRSSTEFGSSPAVDGALPAPESHDYSIEGRLVLTWHAGGSVALFNLYAPAGTSAEPRERVALRLAFFRALERLWSRELARGRCVVSVGDYNVCPDDADVAGGKVDCWRADRQWLRTWVHARRAVEAPTAERSGRGDSLKRDEDEEACGTDGARSAAAFGQGRPSCDEAGGAPGCSGRADAGPQPFAPSAYVRPRLFDSFRRCHPGARRAFTCWNTSTRARELNQGARIDLALVGGAGVRGRWESDEAGGNGAVGSLDGAGGNGAVGSQDGAGGNGAVGSLDGAGGNGMEQSLDEFEGQTRNGSSEVSEIASHPPPSVEIVSSDVHPEIEGSDHCPISVLLRFRSPLPAVRRPAEGEGGGEKRGAAQTTLKELLWRREGKGEREREAVGCGEGVWAAGGAAEDVAGQGGSGRPCVAETSSRDRACEPPAKKRTRTLFEFMLTRAENGSAKEEGDRRTANETSARSVADSRPSAGFVSPSPDPAPTPDAPRPPTAASPPGKTPCPEWMARELAAAAEYERSRALEAAEAWRGLVGRMRAPMCRHHEPAVRKRVNKAGENKGRWFFACARPAGPMPKGNCGFFQWVVEQGSRVKRV